MHICRIEDGQLVEHRPVIDQMALRQQLGALPEGDPAN
jgi:predicted ester cyclase